MRKILTVNEINFNTHYVVGITQENQVFTVNDDKEVIDVIEGNKIADWGNSFKTKYMEKYESFHMDHKKHAMISLQNFLDEAYENIKD